MSSEVATPPQAPGHESGGGGRASNRYLAVLRLPGALGFSSAGFLARMPMSMFSLGTVLLIAALTGSYGLAGAVAAAGSVSYAVAAPQVARLTDRFGQRRVLRPQVAAFASATAVFLSLAEAHAPVAAILAAGAVAGGTMPSMGSMVRARWSALLAGGDLLHTAFSLESVADEFIFVLGPALVTLLATGVHPAAGVATAAAACVLGTLLFAAQRQTEPPPRPRGAGQALARAGRRSLAAPGLVAIVPVYLCVGAMFATVDLATVAFSAQHRHLRAAGLVLAAYALGSAVGGLWYGSRRWRAPLERRFAITLGISVCGVCLLWFQQGMTTLLAVIFAAGLAISPTLIAGYGLVERQAPEHRRTEAMAWLSSSISVGVAAGSPVAGRVIDAAGAGWGYVFAAGAGLAALAVAIAGQSRLRHTAADPLAPPAPATVGVNPTSGRSGRLVSGHESGIQARPDAGGRRSRQSRR